MSAGPVTIRPRPAIRWSWSMYGAAIAITGALLLVFVPDPKRGWFALLVLAGLAVLTWGASPATVTVVGGRLRLRHGLRRSELAASEIARIACEPTVPAADGRLAVTLVDGRTRRLAGTWGARPRDVVAFLDAVVAVAPAATIDVDLSRFPTGTSHRRGVGRYPAAPLPPAPDHRPVRVHMGALVRCWWCLAGAVPLAFGVLLVVLDGTPAAFVGGSAAILMGLATIGAALRARVEIHGGELVIRNPLRTGRVRTADVAAIRSVPVMLFVDRSFTNYGRLIVTDRTGRDRALVGTTGARAEAVVDLVDNLLHAAPAARLGVDLATFPHVGHRRAGAGRFGPPPPLDDLVAVEAQLREELRKQDGAGPAELEAMRAHLDQLRRERDT